MILEWTSVDLGLFLDQFGMISASFWDHFGITRELLWEYFGIILGHLVTMHPKAFRFFFLFCISVFFRRSAMHAQVYAP